MIKIEKTQIWGWESAIRGMRNPMNSWNNSDSDFSDGKVQIGENDLSLMERLSKSGTDHAKFMRFINVTADITAPRYWWTEYDTYKVGTVANSSSTMHKIHEKEIVLDDFSHEQLSLIHERFRTNDENEGFECTSVDLLKAICTVLNYYRCAYLKTGDKTYWWQMIQLLPSSYNQKRTVQLNYAVLKNMYHARKNHKLDEWREFCSWIEKLPYVKKLIIAK